jgi:type II secretory pathway pseudopilin PulG
MRRSAAFSLVELLIVIGIIMLLMGMIVVGSRSDQRDAQVRGAAEELAAVLRATHQRALATSQCYGVAFNIQNAPGSSGAILNNRSGGHSYRVLGPAQRTRYVWDLRHLIPWSGGKLTIERDQGTATGNFPDFIADVEASWIDAPHVLPPGKVRFLALGDTDEGPRWRGSPQTYYSSTYPRPWFGYFDPVAKRLWPWGGYDPGDRTSGFYYQGAMDPSIVGSVNPSDRLVNHDWDRISYLGGAESTAWGSAIVIADVDRNGDGDTSDPDEKEVNYPLWLKDAPRPLVNSAWLDACLVFLPDGTVFFGEWNRARRFYRNTAPTGNGASRFFAGLSGIPDRAMKTSAAVQYPSWGMPLDDWMMTITDRDIPKNAEIPEVSHFDRHTGGWHLTLGPDVLDDRTTFTSPAEALDTMTPAYRVFVSWLGVVRTVRVQRRSNYLASLPSSGSGSRWPPAPTDWSNTGLINSRCKMGYLHQAGNSGIINGSPIVDIIDPQMLAERVWWRQ